AVAARQCHRRKALSVRAVSMFNGTLKPLYPLVSMHFHGRQMIPLDYGMLFLQPIVRRKTAAHFCWKCSLSNALSDAKPLRTFAGNALFPTHCPTQNRFALLLEMLLC